ERERRLPVGHDEPRVAVVRDDLLQPEPAVEVHGPLHVRHAHVHVVEPHSSDMLSGFRTRMAIRCVYTDLDGTLLGSGASLFRDGEGNFTLLPARALEACHRAGVEVVIKSGRRKTQVMEDARLMGQTAYIYEVGSGLVVDGEEILLT